MSDARDHVLERANGACEFCRDEHVADSDDEPEWVYHSITTGLPGGGDGGERNLIYLCAECADRAEDARPEDVFDPETGEAYYFDETPWKEYIPSALYRKIGSSYEEALDEAEGVP